MNDLIENLEASGLKPIVIDEDFDFATLSVKRESNTEFLTRIMNVGCPTGSLIQAFVIEALTRYSKDVLESDNEWDNGLINSVTWSATAEWLKAELDKKYGAA